MLHDIIEPLIHSLRLHVLQHFWLGLFHYSVRACPLPQLLASGHTLNTYNNISSSITTRPFEYYILPTKLTPSLIISFLMCISLRAHTPPFEYYILPTKLTPSLIISVLMCIRLMIPVLACISLKADLSSGYWMRGDTTYTANITFCLLN